MSDDNPPYGDAPPPGGQQQPPPPPSHGSVPPNWGGAYPPPGGGYPPQGYPVPPKHPQAVTAMVLGIVGITGLACCLTFFAAPFAWVVGAKAVREIDASPQTYSGRSEANAGKILGIVGTVLLVLAVLLAVLLAIGLAVGSAGFQDSDPFDGYVISQAF